MLTDDLHIKCTLAILIACRCWGFLFDAFSIGVTFSVLLLFFFLFGLSFLFFPLGVILSYVSFFIILFSTISMGFTSLLSNFLC